MAATNAKKAARRDPSATKEHWENDLPTTGVQSKTADLTYRREWRATRPKPWTEDLEGLRRPLLNVRELEDDQLGTLAGLHAPLLQQSSEALSALREFADRGSSTIRRPGFVKAMMMVNAIKEKMGPKEIESMFDLCTSATADDCLDIFAFRRTVLAAHQYHERKMQAKAKAYKRPVDEEHYQEGVPVYTYSGQALNYRTLQARRMLKQQTANRGLHATMHGDFLTQSLDFSNPHDDMMREKIEEIAKRTHPKGFQFYIPREPNDFRVPPKTLHHTQKEHMQQTRYHEERSRGEATRVRYSTCKFCGAKNLIEREKCKSCRSMFNTLGHISKTKLFGYKNHTKIVAPSVHEPDLEERLHKLSLEEKEKWREKLLGDKSGKMMTYLRGNFKAAPSHLDRNETILKDPPMKKALKKTTVELYPHNMFQSEPMYKEQTSRGFSKVQLEEKHELRANFDKNRRKAQANFSYVHKSAQRKPISSSDKTGPKWGSS